MRNINQLWAILLAFLSSVSLAKKSPNAILLSNVKSLTLRGDQLTTAGRVKAIPQLQCVGGNAKGYYSVDAMRCRNSGNSYDGEDIQWTCQAELPPEFKLGSTDVICEGYDSPDDPYVLKGSCGVEYRLALTDLGEEKYGEGGWGAHRKSTFGDEGRPSTIYTILFWLVFLGIIGFIVYKAFVERTNTGRNFHDGFRRNYWGGGGDDDDPPPPYTPRAPPRARPKTTASKSTGPRSPSSRTNTGGWRPGFWTGAAAGAAGGYMAGNRNSARTQTAQAGPSNWFNTGARNNAPAAPFRGGGGSSQDWASPRSEPSSSRYDSTGFGGTSRR